MYCFTVSLEPDEILVIPRLIQRLDSDIVSLVMIRQYSMFLRQPKRHFYNGID